MRAPSSALFITTLNYDTFVFAGMLTKLWKNVKFKWDMQSVRIDPPDIPIVLLLGHIEKLPEYGLKRIGAPAPQFAQPESFADGTSGAAWYSPVLPWPSDGLGLPKTWLSTKTCHGVVLRADGPDAAAEEASADTAPTTTTTRTSARARARRRKFALIYQNRPSRRPSPSPQ
jgi:hypothetical protein